MAQKKKKTNQALDFAIGTAYFIGILAIGPALVYLLAFATGSFSNTKQSGQSISSYREEINDCITETDEHIYELEQRINEATDRQGGDYDEMNGALYDLDGADSDWFSCIEYDWKEDDDSEVENAVSCLLDADEHIYELNRSIHEATDLQGGEYDELDSALSELNGTTDWSGCNKI